MGDPLSVAAGIVGIVGFAGQILEGITFLHGFFSDIKEAPEVVGDISTELALLNRIIKDVQTTNADAETVRDAINCCNHWIDKLRSLVHKYEPSFAPSGLKRSWSQLSVAFRMKNFRKYADGLSNARSILLQAQMNAVGSSNVKILESMEELHSSVAKIGQDQADITTILVDAQTTTHEIKNTMDTLSSHLAEHVSAEVGNTLHWHRTMHSDILNDMSARVTGMESNHQDIKLALRSLLQNSESHVGQLATIIQPILERTISEHLKSPQVPELQKNDPQDSFRTTNTKAAASQSVDVHAMTGILSLSQLSSSKTMRRSVTRKKRYRYWFGILDIIESLSIEWESLTVSDKLRRTESREVDIRVIPAPWMLRTGAILQFKQLVGAVPFQIQPAIRMIRIIGWDNPVVNAIDTANLSQVRRLVGEGKVHPSDIFPDGSSLLMKTFECQLCKLHLFHEHEWPPRPQGLDGLEVAIWLLQNGFEIDTSNSDEIFTCFLRCLGRLGRKQARVEMTVSSTEIDQTLAKLVNIMATNAHCLTNVDSIFDVLETSWWRNESRSYSWVVPIMSKCFSIEHATLSSLTLLSFTVKMVPRFCLEIPSSVCPLIEDAIRGKMWLGGDDKERADSLQRVARIIKKYLKPAIPLNWSKDTHQRWRVALSSAESIAIVLKFDEDVVDVDLDGWTLTDIAVQARTLDIWIIALTKAGYQVGSVIDRSTWDANWRYYTSHEIQCTSWRHACLSITTTHPFGLVSLKLEDQSEDWDCWRQSPLEDDSAYFRDKNNIECVTSTLGNHPEGPYPAELTAALESSGLLDPEATERSNNHSEGTFELVIEIQEEMPWPWLIPPDDDDEDVAEESQQTDTKEVLGRALEIGREAFSLIL